MLETHRVISGPDLQTSVSKLLDDVSTKETIISHRPRAGLVCPGGVPFARCWLKIGAGSRDSKVSWDTF
jgi:hypothetical protein